MTTAKDFIFEDSARDKLREGIEKLTDIVRLTLGPRGHNVGIEIKGDVPHITNDGNSIVKDIQFPDAYVNMGATLGKEVVAKMQEKCGDGTTTSLLILCSLVQNGIKHIAAGVSSIGIKRGMEKALEEIVKALHSLAYIIKNDQDLKNIAKAAAGGDETVGALVSEAIRQAGLVNIVAIEESQITEHRIVHVKGMELNCGYISPYFCTYIQNLSVTMQNGKILITDKKIGSIQEILSLLQNFFITGQELLIVADDIEPDALSTLIFNKIKGTLKVCIIKAPSFGNNRKALLEDLATLTGGTLISEDMGMLLSEVSVDLLGEAEKIVVSKDKTLIVGGKGEPRKIQDRIYQLNHEWEETSNIQAKEEIQKRKANLSEGVTIIQVGAFSEHEMKEKKHIFEDSLRSTQAALEEGVVPGGGIALLHASQAAKNLKLSSEEMVGVQIVCKACEAPFRQLISNSNYDSSLILDEILSKGLPMGFNILTEKVEDLSLTGVIDPLKTVKYALHYAISAAGTVLLSEGLVIQSEDTTSFH